MDLSFLQLIIVVQVDHYNAVITGGGVSPSYN